MCMVGDDSYWDFFTAYRPKAKVEHICVECGRTIAKGETYRTEGGLTDGSFVWHKTCEQCAAASEWLMDVCDGYIYRRRQEDFLNHVVGDEKFIRSRPLVRLVRWMLADWRDRYGNLRPVEDVIALTNEAIRAWRAQRALPVAS